MSIPYNDHLQWTSYTSNPDWYKGQTGGAVAYPCTCKAVFKRAGNEILTQIHPQLRIRGEQFFRDGLRLVLKVPIRSIITPIWQSKNWKEFERSKVNLKLTGYSFVQLISVPVKFFVALAAIAISAISCEKAHWLLNKSVAWTIHLDGRASQLEALKEEGKKAGDRAEYNKYKNWLYAIDPLLCRKT